MRLLIMDQDPANHDAYQRSFRILSGDVDPEDCLDGEALSGEEPGVDLVSLECVFHVVGDSAVEEVQRSVVTDSPFAVAFVGVSADLDVKEWVGRIRELDPSINLVLVANDRRLSPPELQTLAGPPDKIFYLVGPTESAEIVQITRALSRRWEIDRELAAARTALSLQVAALEQHVAELATNEGRARHLASYDTLTDAPNRLAFLRALGERGRQPGMFAVAALDLDRFKLINDSLGHLAGDEVIRQTCRTLRSVIPEGGMVARLAGDEFGLLFDAAGDEAAAMVCERMVVATGASMRVLGHKVQVSASAGVVVAPESGARDPVDLMRQADLALNDAKRSGRNLARLFEPRMDEGIRVRRAVESGLGRAIARGELTMLFQPIVANGSYEIVGFEALMRWYTDEFGPISPGTFIPIAEETDLIHELGDWALIQSLEAAKGWPEQYVSVNFSPRQFRRQNFVGNIVERVQRAGIDPQRLQIEITETAIFDDAERAADTLYKLRQMGFRVVLDDFGTGYSSLDNLRKFALDGLKIERSFIDGLERERESAAIVRSIVQLGRALSLEVIAEGVETRGQVALLRAAGASHLQGFLFSHPIGANDAQALANAGFVDRPGGLVGSMADEVA
ncbi:EAL domain-containing protein [Sphingomonas sp. IC-11]|uniref:putative bifunctional diguanylate cyclase/phosphodiesterase n=1 Tax=Sphingomonas sp. IC-11 TaxID=2898528 RepID=UPI001E5BC312|nr:EAL domain-containing protein [Sphingomonas sp. IC-11]MCD2316049.1 EAL domain-containing protein [Sphingomonas sp. IC-11]